MEQLESLDYAALAAECEIDAEGLSQTYKQLAEAGLRTDPAVELIDLMDQIRRSRRDKLTGAARRAVDFYDAARVLRSWHNRLTDEWLPDVDELRGLNGTAYKKRRYDTVNVRGNRGVLPVVLEEFGLYPWRVQLIAEGRSEVTALRLILKEAYGLSFERLGIGVTDMGGADIPKKTEQLLSSFRGYANYFLLVFDNEGRAAEMTEALVQAEVIEGVGDEQRKAIRDEAAKAAKQIQDETARKEALREALDRANDLSQEPGAAPEFVLWKDNFEFDNFTKSELRRVIEDYAHKNGLDDFQLIAEEIEKAVKKGKKKKSSKKGIASLLLDTAKKRDSRFELSKPDFARLLAEFALANPELKGKRRQILDLAEHLVQLTSADRRLIGRLREHS
jgi:hypothetical protein